MHLSKSAVRQYNFYTLYDTYGASLYGIVLTVTHGDGETAASLMKEIFVEYFCSNKNEIETGLPIFTGLVQVLVKTTLQNGYDPALVREAIFNGS